MGCSRAGRTATSSQRARGRLESKSISSEMRFSGGNGRRSKTPSGGSGPAPSPANSVSGGRGANGRGEVQKAPSYNDPEVLRHLMGSLYAGAETSDADRMQALRQLLNHADANGTGRRRLLEEIANDPNTSDAARNSAYYQLEGGDAAGPSQPPRLTRDQKGKAPMYPVTRPSDSAGRARSNAGTSGGRAQSGGQSPANSATSKEHAQSGDRAAVRRKMHRTPQTPLKYRTAPTPMVSKKPPVRHSPQPMVSQKLPGPRPIPMISARPPRPRKRPPAVSRAKTPPVFSPKQGRGGRTINRPKRYE